MEIQWVSEFKHFLYVLSYLHENTFFCLARFYSKQECILYLKGLANDISLVRFEPDVNKLNRGNCCHLLSMSQVANAGST